MSKHLPLLLVLLPACVQPRPAVDADAELQPPAAWSAAATDASAAVLADGWWRDFHRPELEALIEEAFAANWDLAATGLRVDAAAAEARIATGARWPELDLGLDLSRSRRNFIGLPVPGATNGVLAVESESHALSLRLGWEADLWGRLDAGERAAMGELQAAQADWFAVRLSLAGQVVRAWLTLAAADERVALARAAVSDETTAVESLALRFEQGRAAAAEILSRRADLASAGEALEAARTERQSAARALELLLGRYPSGSIRVSGLAALPDEVPPGLPAGLVSRRPDLSAAEARLRAALARADQAEASLYPRLTLTASGGTSTADLGELLNGDFKVWSLAAGITAPLFHGGELRAGLDAAEAASGQARAGFLGATLAAFAEVEGALDGEQRLRTRLEHAERAWSERARAERSVAASYDQGRADLTTLLSARAATRAAASKRLDATLGLLVNRVDLYLALGGGFASPTP